jgi:hypothetical protein
MSSFTGVLIIAGLLAVPPANAQQLRVAGAQLRVDMDSVVAPIPYCSGSNVQPPL